jgi:hypothetical protein
VEECWSSKPGVGSSNLSRGSINIFMANYKKELEKAIDDMVHLGQLRFETEGERRIYAYAFVRSMLVDLALQDSLVYRSLLAKYKKTLG